MSLTVKQVYEHDEQIGKEYEHAIGFILLCERIGIDADYDRMLHALDQATLNRIENK